MDPNCIRDIRFSKEVKKVLGTGTWYPSKSNIFRAWSGFCTHCLSHRLFSHISSLKLNNWFFTSALQHTVVWYACFPRNSPSKLAEIKVSSDLFCRGLTSSCPEPVHNFHSDCRLFGLMWNTFPSVRRFACHQPSALPLLTALLRVRWIGFGLRDHDDDYLSVRFQTSSHLDDQTAQKFEAISP